MFTLHWEYMAGSIVAQALLLDVQAEFDLRYVDMGKGEHKEAEYLDLNPTGRVPALTLPDGTTIGETGAIVTFLGEAFPQSGITPLPGETDRAEFLFWLNVMATTGYVTIARWNHPERYAFAEAAIAEVERKAASDLDQFFNVVEGAIAGRETVLKRGFSALDYYLAMLTEWPTDRATLFATRPKIEALYASVRGRPEYEETLKTHLLP